MRIGSGITAVAATAVLTVGAASGAASQDLLLRPGVGAGQVRLGMTLAEVRAELGQPSRVERRERHGFRSRYVEYAWGVTGTWRVGVLESDRAGSRVVFLATTHPARTRRDAGVGSTHRFLQRTLGARCYRRRSELPGRQGNRPFTGCHLGRRGGAVTYFPLELECSVPTDDYLRCPSAKRQFVAYEVWIADVFGQEIKGVFEPPAP